MYTMEYSAIKMKLLLIYAKIWMNLKITLNERQRGHLV